MSVVGTPIPSSDPGIATRRAAGILVIDPPSGRPITWAEAKAHLRFDTDERQTYVETLIDAAADFAEQAMGCSLIVRTLLATFSEPAANLLFPLLRGPLVNVLSVVDADDAAIDYQIRHAGRASFVVFVGSSSPAYPISITYRAGYESAAEIPGSIRVALMQHVASLFENPESISDRAKMPVPQSLADFYARHSRQRGIA